MIKHRLLASAGFAAVTISVFLLASVSRADDATQPVAGAARLSSVEGQVRISQGGQVLADPALVNAPLFTGTRVETGDDGKAEIQFDDGSVVRLAPGSALLLTLIGGPQGSSIGLESGLAYFELQPGAQGAPMRVAFGDSMATATGFTVMRVKLDNPPGELAVFSGNAHLERGNSMAVDLHGGQSVALNATDPSHYNLSDSIEPDSWDSWNSDRDQALNAESADQTGAANNFTNNATPAWNDLDANGNWYNVPSQGYVWSPYDASNPGFDPYGNGNWMGTPGYGYVFVSGYPWGYLPYQCGAWNFYDGFGWGWAPGVGMGGCRPWWRNGVYGGLNIGIAPRGYRQIVRPVLRGPGNRFVASVVPVKHSSFYVASGTLPVRNRYSPVEIAGATVPPLRPIPSQQHFQPSLSGYVYHPAGGYQGTRSENYLTNDVRTTPVGRASYVPAPEPRYTAVPNVPPPSALVSQPGAANGTSNANIGAPVAGVPGGGRVGKPPDAHQSWSTGRTTNNNVGNQAPRSSSPPSATRSYSPPPSAPRSSGGGGGGNIGGGGGGGGGGSHASSGGHH